MLKRIITQSPQSIFMLLYFGLMPTVLGSVLAGFALTHSQELESMSIVSLFVFNLLFSFALGFGLMPTTFYSLLAGYFFGWPALLFLALSYAIASAFGYWLCGKFDRGGLVRLFGEKYPIETMMVKLSNSGILLSSLCRMSPTLPFAVLNCLFALVRFPFYQYMVGSMLGMLPRTIFAIYIGSKFTHVHSVSELHSDASTWFAIALATVSFVGIGWIVKRKFF